MTPERWQQIEKLYYDSQDRTPQERALSTRLASLHARRINVLRR